MMNPPGAGLLAFLLAAAPPLGAEVLESITIAPGLLYARYQKGGLIAHALKLDLRTRNLHLRSVKAKGKETVRQMVERRNDEETMVVAGINGDFFRQDSAAGLPYGVQVSDGRLVFAPLKRSMIGFGPATTAPAFTRSRILRRTGNCISPALASSARTR